MYVILICISCLCRVNVILRIRYFNLCWNVCKEYSKYTVLKRTNRLIGLVGRVVTNGPGDLDSKTLKMALDTSLLNTQLYKVRIKGKVEQSREGSCALPYTSV